jgi:tartrate dehydratase beta subunit/fumarate hydratase class I family protein
MTISELAHHVTPEVAAARAVADAFVTRPFSTDRLNDALNALCVATGRLMIGESLMMPDATLELQRLQRVEIAAIDVYAAYYASMAMARLGRELRTTIGMDGVEVPE